jgi:VWFA-related protein
MQQSRWLAALTVLAVSVVMSSARGLDAARPGPGQSATSAPPPQAAPKPAQPQRPTFSTTTLVVPVIVRAVDNKTGKPVTDLQQEDFTLLENGVPQPIRHFEKRAYVTDAPPAPGVRPPLRESALGLEPQNSRIFLIVLGRGRLQEPSKALDALQRFVREQLLPQDQVAILAYDRASDFTTDHELIAKFIDRFKKEHYQIDLDVRLAIESGLAGIYGSQSLPKKTRDRIDSMFTGAGLLASRQVGKGANASTQRADADFAKQVDKAQNVDIQKQGEQLAANEKLASTFQQPPWTGNWTELDEVQAPIFASLGLDDFVQITARSLQDLGTCYAAVEYLRHLEGDKHLVFVTERGLNLPRLEDDMDLAKAANDARVAIDTFQVGGLLGQQGGTWSDQSQQTFAFKGLRMVAEQTGGVSSIAEDGMVAVNRINEVSRSEYLLGFYPSRGALDGNYRKIEVKTKRSGITLLYRQGYYGRTEVGSYNRRDAVTRERLQASAFFRRTLDDLKVKLKASQGRKDGQNEVTVKVNIDVSRLFLSLVDGKKVGSVDVLAICFDDKDAPIGQFYQRANVDLAPEMYDQLLKSGGLPYQATFEASPATRRVRVVVYDYHADLVGSTDARIY